MSKPTKTLVVDADGYLLVASNNLISGDRELVKLIKYHNLAGTRVQIVEPFGETIMVDLDTPDNIFGILAGLFSVKPGRTRLLEAPDEVWEWLDRNTLEYGEPDSSYDE